LIMLVLSAGIVAGSIGISMAGDPSGQTSLPVKKEIPEITLENLSPPFKDYDYFQGGERFPFRFNITSFDGINAWWLAEASTLAYADEDFVRSRFREAGLPEVTFFEKEGTECYVANNDRFAIVAFRGSELSRKKEKADLNVVVADLRTDMDFRLTDWEQGGKVHRGFKEALDEVWPDLLPHVRKIQEKGCKIWVTGHSLGGALATLFAGRYGNVQGVYTFGSPRVGNEVFKEHFEAGMYRFVNNRDIVPRLPPPGAYVHVGTLKFIDRDGILKDTMIENERPDHSSRDETDGQEQSSQTKRKSSGGFVPAAFRNHVPLLYAIHLWNNIIESRP
jgi:triacylglycerol lipase